MGGREDLKDCCKVDENLDPRPAPGAPRPPHGTFVTRVCCVCTCRHIRLFLDPIPLFDLTPVRDG